MYAIATFTLVALLTLIVTRLATGVLMATGLPAGIARFQARSAYSGSGFTTTEAENVVNHPVRRRVVYSLMLIGSLGTPTLVVTVVPRELLKHGDGNLRRRDRVGPWNRPQMGWCLADLWDFTAHHERRGFDNHHIQWLRRRFVGHVGFDGNCEPAALARLGVASRQCQLLQSIRPPAPHEPAC